MNNNEKILFRDYLIIQNHIIKNYNGHIRNLKISILRNRYLDDCNNYQHSNLRNMILLDIKNLNDLFYKMILI